MKSDPAMLLPSIGIIFILRIIHLQMRKKMNQSASLRVNLAKFTFTMFKVHTE